MKITKLLFFSLFATLSTHASLSTNGTGFVTNVYSEVFYIGPRETLSVSRSGIKLRPNQPVFNLL